MKRVSTSAALAIALLVPSASIATAHRARAHRADASGSLAAKLAGLASCLNEHGVSIDAASITKRALDGRIAEPGVRAALQACGHVPGD